MKGNLLKGLRLLILLIAIGVTYFFSDRLLSLKTLHGICQARDMYAQPENTIDVVFMGSSHVHYNINTAQLWEEYGIASYDYSSAEQPLWVTYYYLQEICKYQNPQLIVLDLYCPARFKDDYQYYYLTDSLNGMKFSLNKVKMLNSCCEPQNLFDYFPSIVTYHSRYSELEEEDFEYLLASTEDRSSFKGYTPYFKVSPQKEPEWDCDAAGGLTAKSEEYLLKIIDYCRQEGMDLYLTVTPYLTSNEDELVYNRIHEIADEQGLNFDSSNYSYEEMGLNFKTDFNDDSHLNYFGSCKYTSYLAKNIKNSYDIPDRRGLDKWESWDRHAAEVRTYVNRQLASSKDKKTG